VIVTWACAAGYWPTQSSIQCELPPEIAKACAVFKRFYLEQHNGRQLTWQVYLVYRPTQGGVRAFRSETGSVEPLGFNTG